MHDANGTEMIGQDEHDGLGSYVKCGVEGPASIRISRRRFFHVRRGKDKFWGYL